MVLAYRPAIVAQLSNWHVLPEAERVTELYFTDYTVLPKSLAAGSHYTIAFTVHNLEHQATVYHYKLTATSDQGTEHSLGNGTFMLNHDDIHLGSADVVVPVKEPHLAIKVELYYKGFAPSNTAETIQTQSINFGVAVTGSRADGVAL